jgi:4-hydroxy-tetrahydrodipicolinate synthase
MPPNFSGVIVASLTPFHDGDVSSRSFADLIDFIGSKGIQAIFICGTSGEGPIMTVSQRKRAAEIAVEKSRIPVIVHSGTNNEEDTIDLARHAKDIGASAHAVITPMFYPYTNEGLVSYFQKVEGSCDIPMFIYSNPTRTGVRMAPEVYSALVRGNILGVKESSGDMSYLGRVIHSVKKGAPVFNGADACFLPGLVLGTSGQVSGYANLTPELYVELFSAWKRGDMESAMRIQARITKIRALLESPYIQPIKEGLKFRGVDAGDVKPPLVKMGQKEIESLRSKLADLEPDIFGSP